MGSILGGSATDRDLACSGRSSDGRTYGHVTPLSPRAALYSLDTSASRRISSSETFSSPVNGRLLASGAVRPSAWCAAVRQAAVTALAGDAQSCKACCGRGPLHVVPPGAAAHGRWCFTSAPRLDVRRGRKVLPLPAVPAAAEADMEVPYTSTSGVDVIIRKIHTLDELRQVAALRAEAYYAENQSRFVGSLKKKFVEQEVESLQQRTTIMSRQGKPYSECLVAVDASSSAVLACIDVRLPAALNGMHPHGVPQDDPTGCYLLNVVVREDMRGQGLGRGVMRAAMARAVHVWAAGRLYTHVEADNEVAYRLYKSCGFEQHSTDAKYEAASKLGQTVLLCAPAAVAAADA